MPSALFFALSKRRRKTVAIASVCVALNIILGLSLPKLPRFYSSSTLSDARILQHVWQPPLPQVLTSMGNMSVPQLLQHQMLLQQRHRPIMHTFFTTLARRKHSEQNPAGMSDEAHTRMLSVWSQSWWEAGWYPLILTMEDAKKHENFESLHKIMETFKMNSYNLACFYRWIAMAAVGGGWMSDYDVLPLYNFTQQGINLPMQGSLMVHDGYHVPSLVSGNASEWNRVLQRLIDHASSTKTTVHLKRSHKTVVTRTPSDMQTLVELRAAEPTLFQAEATVAGVEALTSPISPRDWNQTYGCLEWTPPTTRAIHFAHAYLGEGYFKLHPDQSMEDRPDIAQTWLREWKASCLQQDWQPPVSSQHTATTTTVSSTAAA